MASNLKSKFNDFMELITYDNNNQSNDKGSLQKNFMIKTQKIMASLSQINKVILYLIIEFPKRIRCRDQKRKRKRYG
jgi:hypothetical protein